MTNISRDDVARLAMMSSLQLSDDQLDSLQADLQSILGYIEQLSQLDTTNVEPTYQVTGLENVWRDDVVELSVAGDALVQLAPEHDTASIKVPKVL